MRHVICVLFDIYMLPMLVDCFMNIMTIGKQTEFQHFMSNAFYMMGFCCHKYDCGKTLQ